MSQDLPRHRVTLYRRAGCPLCDEAAEWLQAALEERVRRGDTVPAIRHVDVDSDAGLAERYGGLVPVLATDGAELPLVMSGRQLRAFLDRHLPRIA